MTDVELAHRVARLEAMNAINDLATEYCSTVDAIAGAAHLAPLFAPDCVMRNPSVYEGRDAIIEYYDQFFAADITFSRHSVVNRRVSFEADGHARFQASFVAVMIREGVLRVVFGDYDDRVAFVDGGWRYVEKVNNLKKTFELERGWRESTPLTAQTQQEA